MDNLVFLSKSNEIEFLLRKTDISNKEIKTFFQLISENPYNYKLIPTKEIISRALFLDNKPVNTPI